MSDNLSQNDIDKLLSGMSSDDSSFDSGFSGSDGILTTDEKDTLGELCNISMSAAATTLSEILNNRVEVTTPKVFEFSNISEVISAQEDSTIVEIKYLSGLDASVLFLLKNTDVAIIADLMMGGTGLVDSNEIGELQLSAVGEAMNQMMGASATNLSSIFNQQVDISPPKVTQLLPGQDIDLPMDLKNTPIVGIVFRLSIGTLLDSELIQLMSIENAQTHVQLFMGSVDTLLQGVSSTSGPPTQAKASGDQARMFGSAPGVGQDSGHSTGGFSQQPVTIQPARFSSFDSTSSMYGMENQNLDLVLDVGLKLTVELGRSELPIKKVLELTRGSVIELDKVAGEPVDLLANGKLIAKGEVVVIEDNFGLRITSIISPADRLKNL